MVEGIEDFSLGSLSKVELEHLSHDYWMLSMLDDFVYFTCVMHFHLSIFYIILSFDRARIYMLAQTVYYKKKGLLEIALVIHF